MPKRYKRNVFDDLFEEYEIERFQESDIDKIAPAVVGAAIAAAGLGYTIFKDIFGNEGDVTWNLASMEGAKYPWDDKNTYHNRASWRRKVFTVKRSVTNLAGDEISATFNVEYWHNGYAVGYVTITSVESNDAVGWGLSVDSRITADPNTYETENRTPFARIFVRFTYRFSRSIGADVIRSVTYTLRGTGIRTAD